MKKLIPLIALSAVFTAAVSATSLSETNSQDKSQYNLFNPTPVDLMRPMYSDQYDGVFDAHTLDAGHIQIESSLINYGEFSERYNYPFGSYHFTEEEYSWSPRFRIGLLNFMDFDVSPTYAVRSYTLSGRIYNPPSYPPFQTFSDRVHSSAFGDVGLGSTINLWGNDGGPTSLAIHPFVTVPTDRDDWSGGVGIPFGWQLPLKIYLKLESEFAVAEISPHINYGQFYNAISLHRPICSRAEVYWYLDSTVTSDSAVPWFGYTGFGSIFKVTPNLEFFGGIGFGLGKTEFGMFPNAFDYNPRFGIVWRY
jgi:hypothetical protein